MVDRPERLLTQNSELRRIGVWNWSLPAWAGRLPDGRTYNTCPSAGVCRKACYALSGTYRFRNVKARHEQNLQYLLDDLPGWEQQMLAELEHPRFAGKWVRIHDAGDFFSDAYLLSWLHIALARPKTTFYAYTKEVERFRRLVEPAPPANFRWVYSLGGTQDGAVDEAVDRVADVFPDIDSMDAAGYADQSDSDLLAVLGPRLVGIPANNIPQFRRRQAGRRFRDWQAEEDAQRRERARA